MQRTFLFSLLAGAMVLGACVPQEQAGQADFDAYCAACHGVDARGNGPVSVDLNLNAPDLTLIAQRNGGDFPFTQVMSTIDGYTRADQHGSVMPEFGPLLDGPTVLVEYEGGIQTPTPEPLVSLAHYLESIQR